MEREGLLDLGIRMAKAIRHRGPDAHGAWADEKAGIVFGHRRLAIIDLSEAGNQPMVSANERYVITYNGEVYNFRDLRAELEEIGVTFRGHSDTEVILEAIAAWGLTQAVRRFIGMFAFALWDRRDRSLHLVRDRLGIKPLYYAALDDAFLFGSELKSLRAYDGWRPEIDRDSLSAFLRYAYVPTPHTIYKRTRKLPPAHILSIRPGAPPKIERYWDLAQVVQDGRATYGGIGDQEALSELKALLSDAVSRRMISDVPLGAFLSGGIDSSTVVALMQAQSSKQVRTYSIGFGERDLDEAVHAKKVATHLGTDHAELYVSPEHARDVVPTLPEIYDEPFSDSSQIPTFLVSEMTRQHVTVALSGDGGDELFAGYNRYVQAQYWMPFMAVAPGPLRRLVAGTLTGLSPANWTALFRLVPDRWRPSMAGDKLHKLASVLSRNPEDFYRGLASHWQKPDSVVIDGQDRSVAGLQALAQTLTPNAVEQMQYQDILTYLPDDILTKVDRASMAVSLEARVPMIDHRVVGFALALPLTMKLRDGKGKWLLRRLLHEYVPSDLVDRPKAGFAVPLDRWLRGPLREWAEDLLAENKLRSEGLLDADIVLGTWREHLSGQRNWQYHLWNVLMFQAWKGRWIG